MKYLLNIFIFLDLISLSIFSQELQKDQTDIKKLMFNSNNISTVIYNYGSIGRPGGLADIEDLVWDGLGYMYEFGPLISAEVVSDYGDTIHITSDSFVSPSEGDYDPSSIQKWGWLPIPGYSNPNSPEIANSLNTDSWAADWNLWPGEYGPGKIVANSEAYYVMNDFSNAEFSYSPSSVNSAMRGLGISSAVRVYQFGGGLKDALIINYTFTNEGDKNLSKVYFGFQADPHIGGVGDVLDDVVRIVNSANENPLVKGTLVRNTIYSKDADAKGRGGKRPRILSFKFLETPHDLGLTSFHAPAWGSVEPKDDEQMWEFFTDGIDTINYLYNKPGDNVINFSTGPFTLNANETKTVKVALFFSNDFTDLLSDATYIMLHHNWALIVNEIAAQDGDENFHIELNSIEDKISDDYEISWTYSGSSSDVKVFLEYSNNKGLDWFPLAVDLNPNENFIWNTNDVNDGVNFILRIVAYNENNPKEYFYDNIDKRFTIDNTNFNAQPELEIKTSFSDTTITSSPFTIDWISEDADNSNLEIKIDFALNEKGPFTNALTKSFPNGTNFFDWDLKNLPNAVNYFLKISASDGSKDSTLITESFSVDIFQSSLTSANVKRFNGNATPFINIQIVDETQLTNDEYNILFHVNESEKTFDIKNVTTNTLLLSDYNVDENISTSLIDGMKITIKDSGNDIDYNKTRYVSNSANNIKYSIVFPPILGSTKVKLDNDYLIEFNDFNKLEDGSWANPITVETLIGNVSAPFSVWNIKGEAPNFELKEPAPFVLYEPEPNFNNNGQWDVGESLILQPQGSTGPTVSYQISFDIEYELF
ncbi:MAG: hypothetical protein KDC90_13990, partial [Ignavibacteriae bacterium]|nr:hypothetical protein [Ignavibacteriota bacterium]